METALVLGLFGLLAAVGWLAERGHGRPGPATRPPRPPLPMPPPASSVDPDGGRATPDGIGVAREHEVADDVTSAGVRAPTMADWSAVLAPGVLSAGLQLPYVLTWIDLESGGNPCEIGDPRQKGPDGLPRELGIAQVYNPDDLRASGATGAELRAYCVPGDQHEVLYRGRIVRGFSKALLRPIAPDEMARQARLAVDLVARSATSADRDLRAVGAGPAWSRTRRDFWRLVKLQHGLPGISRVGLPAVTKKLGRPPADWAEFRRTLASVTLDPGTEKYRAEFERILNNAERCADAFSERGVA